MDKKKESQVCEECEQETIDFYPTFTNKGKTFICAECHENNIRRNNRIHQLTTNKNNYEK